MRFATTPALVDPHAAMSGVASTSTSSRLDSTSRMLSLAINTQGPPEPSAGGYRLRPGRESWLAVATVVLSLTLSHLVQRLKARRAIRRARQCRSRPSTASGSGPGCRNERKRPTLLAAVGAQFNTWLYLYIIPPWLYAPETVMDALWTAVYCVLMLFLAVYQCPLSISEYPYLYFANRLGVLSYAQTPLIFLLAVKNNPLSPLTGITYQKLNYLHRASARACISFAWLHAILWFLPVLYAGHIFRWYIIWGTLALVSFTGLWVTSIRSLRRKSFEFFLVAHILFSIAFILGAILHWPLKAYWIWPALAIWTLDRLIRFVLTIWINRSHLRTGGAVVDDCSVEVVSKDVLRVTIVRPGLKWAAGQHFFISSPHTGSSIHESHPFSIANMPNLRGEVVFLIRSHNGFTRQLLRAAEDPSCLALRLRLEGPYGHSHPLEHYTSVLLVSGGTGVTFGLSHLLSLLRSVRAGQAATRSIKMVWHVRHAEDIAWITPLLDSAFAERQGTSGSKGLDGIGVKVELQVWVTRSKSSGEPWEMPVITVPTTPMWTRPPSPDEADSIIDGPERSSVTSPHSAETAERSGYGAIISPASSASSGPVIDRAEREEVNEMTRLIPTLGRSAENSTETNRGCRASMGTTSISQPLSAIEQQEHDDRSHATQFAPEPRPKGGFRRMDTQRRETFSGISPATQKIMSLHPGRADLLESVRDMIHDPEDDSYGRSGRAIVVACGPVPLMNDARTAVARANEWKEVRKSGRGMVVEYLEETVGH